MPDRQLTLNSLLIFMENTYTGKTKLAPMRLTNEMDSSHLRQKVPDCHYQRSISSGEAHEYINPRHRPRQECIQPAWC